jgi:hypothetical protein
MQLGGWELELALEPIIGAILRVDEDACKVDVLVEGSPDSDARVQCLMR